MLHAAIQSSLSKDDNAINSKDLENYFDQVWVINLKRREDRLSRFWKEIEKSRWPFRRPQVFNAVEGDKVGVPKYWQTGGGSYGCLRSHLMLLERAIQDDIKSILILEDDAIFTGTFYEDVVKFLNKVPVNWQCLMLGGQHVKSKPFEVTPGVLRAGAGGGIQRTHCYALRGNAIMRVLYLTWANATVHCDWVMGPCTAKFNTYAPDPFLVGQAEGQSDITRGQNPVKFWRSATGTEPVIVLRAPRPVMEELQKIGWHGGYNRDSATGIDKGLCDIFRTAKLGLSENARIQHYSNRLGQWIEMIQGEVLSMTAPAICTIWHSEIDVEMVRALVKGKVFEIVANTVEEAINQLPADVHVHKSISNAGNNIRVILLRSTRAVMEVLREGGWHTGHWRDEVTGLDNGVRHLFARVLDKAGRSAGLRDIVLTLHQEARQLPNGVATLWHDDITPDMLEAEDIQVMEIVAENANEAQEKLKALTNDQRT